MDCIKQLKYWHKLEHFSPAAVHNNSSKIQQDKLPWKVPQKQQDSSKYYHQYTLYFGVFRLNEVVEFVQDFFILRKLALILRKLKCAMLL